ncbi:hypothetical protein SAMN05216496_2432 [Pseudomonas sp. Z003-0.4C(8344-21)]|nr:hypothetical protein SAMN05216496_2432 [Pseudomonas sp. Z003-0.4C(8344-21)]
MRNYIRTITLINLLLLPASTHHDVGLHLGVAVQLSNDQALRQSSSLGSFDGPGDCDIQFGHSLIVSGLIGSAWRKRVTLLIS